MSFKNLIRLKIIKTDIIVSKNTTATANWLVIVIEAICDFYWGRVGSRGVAWGHNYGLRDIFI